MRLYTIVDTETRTFMVNPNKLLYMCVHCTFHILNNSLSHRFSSGCQITRTMLPQKFMSTHFPFSFT